MNVGEKLGVILSTDRWMSIQELRNQEAYEYTDEMLKTFFDAIRSETPYVLNDVKKILS